MRQKAEELHQRAEHLPASVTDHDLERAEETVQELERLGLWPA
jgi:hypothetical protein